MQIADDRVILIHYTLTNGDGETLDSSAGIASAAEIADLSSRAATRAYRVAPNR